jgi:hypothetical protein
MAIAASVPRLSLFTLSFIASPRLHIQHPGLLYERVNVGCGIELHRELPTGVLQKPLSTTAFRLLNIEQVVVAGLKKRDARQDVVIL